MMLLAKVLFWVSVGLLFHSYILFPLSLSLLYRLKPKRKKKELPKDETESLPFVSILMAAFNEELVIQEKLESILASSYPKKAFEVLIGSDCSTDKTNSIVSAFEADHPECIRFFPFDTRQGKPNIINQLISKAKGDFLILTDANVIFDTSTITELMRGFSDSTVGLVDSRMLNRGEKISGISFQEKAYISREVVIKHLESQLWGSMMGPFGGCFAMRKDLYTPIPKNFCVDDFYLNMVVLESKFKAINNPAAVVFEDVSNDLGIEYRRKIRIATGNFQNLFRFWKLLFPPWKGQAYSFISHKVIRWFGPHLLLLGLISALILLPSNTTYLVIGIAYLAFFLIPLIDFFLKKLSIHISLFRFITHFCAMNLAMFVGFLRFGKGVKTNVWQPTKRHQ